MILASASRPFQIQCTADVVVEAGAADSTGPVPIHIDAYGGGVIRVNGIGPLVVDISGIEASGKVVVLDGHTNTLAAALGSATAQPTPDGKQLIAAGTISRTNAMAAKAIELSKDGVPLQASIGAEPIGPPTRVREGQTVHVNGRDITAGPGGFLLFSRSRLRHIALLPNGADYTTNVSIAAAAASTEGIPMTFEEWLSSIGLNAADLSEAQVKALQDAYAALTATASAGNASSGAASSGTVKASADGSMIAASAVTEIRAELAKEAARVASIRKVCGDKFAAIEAQAISEGWDESKAELAVLRASRPRLPAIHVKESGMLNTQAIEAALCMKAGVPVEKSYQEQTLEAAYKVRHRGLDWFADQICAQHGIDLDAPVGSKRWIEAAFSTNELSGSIGNVANKAISAAFEAFPSAAEKICGTASHNNYHTHTVYSIGLGGELQEVTKTGEVKHLKPSDESYTRQVKLRGAILRISEQDFVNDDVGVFKRMADMVANKALVGREKAVFSLLNATGNGDSFFTSARGNYIEGSGTALSHSSLATMNQKLMDQTDPSGDPTLLVGKILLVPSALVEPGKTLLTSDYILGPTSSKQPSNNIWKGAYDLVGSPFLSNANLTGYSSTAHYLLADPAVRAAIEIAYLNDQRVPQVEYFGPDADADTLGVAWRVTYRFGVALAEYRAAVKSRGNG